MADVRVHGPCPVCGRARCCQAKTRTPGAYQDWRHHASPMPNGRCHMHGGKTPVGIASPHFVDGKRSKLLRHLPPTLAPHFNPDDPKLIELREELALIDAGVIEILEQLKAGESAAPKWSAAAAAYGAFTKARETQKAKAMVQHLEALGAILTAGAEASTARETMWDLVDRRARLVVAESRRRKDEHEMVSRDEFGRMARATLMAVFAHVLDAELRGKIQAEVLRILQIEDAQQMIADTVAS